MNPDDINLEDKSLEELEQMLETAQEKLVQQINGGQKA